MSPATALRLFGYALLVLAGVMICQRLGVRGWQITFGYGIVAVVLGVPLAWWLAELLVWWLMRS